MSRPLSGVDRGDIRLSRHPPQAEPVKSGPFLKLRRESKA